jgi:hypothetical protein
MNKMIQKQQGVALVVALILLIVLTLLGLSAMDTTMLEMKLARNSQERAYAFQMAETALRENENLFTNTDFMGDLGVDPDLEVADDDSTTDELSQPVAITRDADKGLVSLVEPGLTVFEYKGSYTIPLGAVGSDWGVGTADGSYFEVSTTARNEASGNITARVRGGYRQLAPSNSKVENIGDTTNLGTIGY